MEAKYEAICRYIKIQLASGMIKPGGKLLSIRELTNQFACSKNTAIHAYQMLEKEHLIYSVPKSGYYAVLRSLTAASHSSDLIDFSSAAPDPSVMPFTDFQHCLNRAIELYQDQLFSYTDPQGFYSLRTELQKHLANSQVFATPDQICVVSGSQQALYLLAAMPFPNGKSTILVEQPTFFGMLRSLEMIGGTVVGIARTNQGIDLAELESHFRNNNIKFFYTVPRFHNPLGTSYKQEEKKQIARLAAKYDVYILEDDYLADLENDHKADPIYSYDQSGHTVYLKSFSKVMLPGLRLGATVLPRLLIETFRLFKASCDSSTTALSQAALEIYMNCGMFDRHTALMRQRYQVRMEALRTSGGRYLSPVIQIDDPAGGIFAQMRIPDYIRSNDLVNALQQRNVLVMPTNRCYLRTFPKENGIRVSIIRTDESQIAKGIQTIAELTQEMLHRNTIRLNEVVQWI